MNAQPPIITAELTSPTDQRFGELLRLYERAIPAEERKSPNEVRSMASSPLHRVNVATSGKAFVGFFLLYVGREVALLEYLATEEAIRGRGVGARLYADARAASGALPLLVEVESDQEEGGDRALRTRRIDFYRRLGCRRIAGLQFILPLRHAQTPPLLDLLVDQAAVHRVDRPTLTRWLTELYVGVYNCSSEDPRLRQMIATIAESVPLD